MLKIEALRPSVYSKQQNSHRANDFQIANKSAPTFCAKEGGGKFIKKALIKLFNIITSRDLIINLMALKKDVKNLKTKVRTLDNTNQELNKTLTELTNNNKDLEKIKKSICGTNESNSTTHKFN